MRGSLACPQGVASCNDVFGISGLVPLFPLAALLAFALAWPLARFVPRRRGVGAALAVIAGVMYLYFSGGAPAVSLLGVVLAVIGLALVMGRRERRDRPAASLD